MTQKRSPDQFLVNEKEAQEERGEDRIKEKTKEIAEEIFKKRMKGEPPYTYDFVDNLLKERGISPWTPEAEEFMRKWDWEQAEKKAKEDLIPDKPDKEEELILEGFQEEKKQKEEGVDRISTKEEKSLKDYEKLLAEKRQAFIEAGKNYQRIKKSKDKTGLVSAELDYEKAKLAYERSRAEYAKKAYAEKIKLLKEQGLDESSPRFKESLDGALNDLFLEIIENEGDNLAKAQLEGLEPRKRTWFRNLMANYATLPTWKKIAISTSIATGLIATGGALGFTAGFASATMAGAYAGQRAIRGAISGKVGALTFGLIKTIRTRQIEKWRKEEIEKLRQNFTCEIKEKEGFDSEKLKLTEENINLVGDILNNYIQRNEEIIRNANRRHRNANLWAIAGAVAAGGATAYFSGPFSSAIAESLGLKPTGPSIQESPTKTSTTETIEPETTKSEILMETSKAAETPKVVSQPLQAPIEKVIGYQGGKSFWQEATKQLSVRFEEEFKNLGASDTTTIEALKIYNIDKIKDAIADAIKSNDMNLIEKYGLAEINDLDKLTENQLRNIKWDEIFKEIFKGEGLMKNLSPEQIENIVKNNATLKEFFEKYPNAPRTSENYENILRGRGDTGTSPITEPQINPESPEEAPTEPQLNEEVLREPQLNEVPPETIPTEPQLNEVLPETTPEEPQLNEIPPETAPTEPQLNEKVPTEPQLEVAPETPETPLNLWIKEVMGIDFSGSPWFTNDFLKKYTVEETIYADKSAFGNLKWWQFIERRRFLRFQDVIKNFAEQVSLSEEIPLDVKDKMLKMNLYDFLKALKEIYK